MTLKVILSTGDAVCGKCGSEVEEKGDKCPSCGASFDGSTTDEEILQFILDYLRGRRERDEEETRRALRIFGVIAGVTKNYEAFLEEIREEISRVEEVHQKSEALLTIIHRQMGRLENLELEIGEVVDSIKSAMERAVGGDREAVDELKKKFEELLTLLDEKHRTVERIRNAITLEVKAIEESFREIGDWRRDIEKKVKQIVEEEKRRELQRKRLLEKEKALLEKEHELKEREKRLLEYERALEEAETKMEKLSAAPPEKGGEVSREDWLAQHQAIQQELFRIREELVKKKGTKVKKLAAMPEEDRELVRRILKVLDDLLGHLPDDKIKEFANSENFELYKKVMKMFGLA